MATPTSRQPLPQSLSQPPSASQPLGPTASGSRPQTEWQWVNATMRLFRSTGLYKPATNPDEKGTGCTNHSIRITACQWCGRCLGSPLDARNNGRWKTYDDMANYYNQGSVVREELTENGGKDPIWSVWVWKRCTSSRIDGKDQM